MKPFIDHRAAAMAILTSGAALRPREGQFLGGIAFDLNPLTEKQAKWLIVLLDRHGLPPFNEGEVGPPAANLKNNQDQSSTAGGSGK